MRTGGVEVIDVREGYEHSAGHIEGSLHIPLGELAARTSALDPSRPIVFACRIGGRSAVATAAFRRAGFEAHNLSGGIVAWDRAGLPLAPAGAYVADH